MTDLVSRLSSLITGEVFGDEATLEHYSRDASLFLVKPQVVVAPRDVAEIKALVKFVAEERGRGSKLSLTARAAGTDMTGGSLSTGIIVDFTKHLNNLRELNLADDGNSGYAVVEPGMYYRDFERETLKKNLFLPCYPASRELCAVGGMVANNSGGEKTLAYGQINRYVKQLKVVLRDGYEYIFAPITLAQLEAKKKLSTLEGDIYRQTYELISANYDLLERAKPATSKNSSGYHLWDVLDKQKGLFDLTQLFVGSQGTLGLHTEIKFGLIKPKAHSRLLVIFLKNKDVNNLGRLVNKILTYNPESFESYDDHTFHISLKLFPKIVKRMGGSAILLAFKFLPEFWALVTGGVPKLVLLAEFTGESDAEALTAAKRALAGISDFGLKARVTSSPDEAKKYWVMRRESFNLLRQHVKGVRTAPFIDDIIVRPEVLPEFLPELYALLDKYPLTYTVAGHMGNGNFHIIPLMDLTKPESAEIIFKLFPEVNKLLTKFGGCNTAEHNDGLLRSAYLSQVYGLQVYALFERVKNIFDPDGLFNPGKKVGATLEYAKAHLDTTGK